MKVTVLFLLFFMPASGISANTVGLVHVSGTGATIDGRPCNTSVNVAFEGEQLATGAQSKATVTSRGTTVSLSSDTSVQLGAKALRLMQGSVVVSSDGGSATQVENVTIATLSGVHAKFLAQRKNDELQLVALEGTVNVIDGQESTPVPAIKGAKIKLPKGAASPSSTSHMNWLSNEDIGILLVVAGGIAAGVALGIANSSSSTPVSSQ
jgi:hypothetical protein